MAHIRPTESELEILQILWEKGEASVRDVHEVLLKNKDAGYTTTLKIMQIMHEKGLVSRDSSARTHIYRAMVSQELTQRHLLGKMIDNVFNGSVGRLIMQALGSNTASAEELAEIKKYLDNLEK
ncbi:penicillinase repressor [Parapedobacter pyrenivorans]|uniref:Penicillinase repressor n=1 Tax=Parapedobacter pyrenivorans TaxID=1305674 RepID=A0A917M869_9SPHI|nr:BlaI/MecI/CopY family transcriptional regulator [Parapedobacter pyrenivorans]GGG81288.1 penicillinase repressor [Parapedobacter pyrenivorans]